MVTLANKITFFRIALIPLFTIFLTLDVSYRKIVAVMIFIFLMLTDALDGYFARKRKEVTTVGKFIDPLADKLIVSAALIFLVADGSVDAWMVFVIIAREFAVTGLRLVAVGKKIVIKASSLGKLKTVTQVVAIIAVLLELNYSWHAMLVATIITILSGIDYFRASRKLIKEIENEI